jgi:hypothetical protein
MVEIVQGEKLTLSCEGVEEVSIWISGKDVVENNDGISVNKEYNSVPGVDYPYLTTLVVSNLRPEDSSEIECLTRNNNSQPRPLHVWKYRVVGKKIIM